MGDSLFQQLHQTLAPFNQEHVLQFWEELNSEERQSIAWEIRALDLTQLDELWKRRDLQSTEGDIAGRISAPPSYRLHDSDQDISRQQAERAGEEVLRAGTVGVVIVAGGQGSRLGFAHPKGMYPIGSVSDASLFQILIEKVRAAGNRFGVPLPVYVMTSPATHLETVDFLEKHERFGLGEDDLVVFCQGVMPAVESATGKLLLQNKASLCLSPDGHGGLLAALDQARLFQSMRTRGVDCLFYVQVDNPLAPVAEPQYLGYHVLSCSDVTTLVIEKRNAFEKVGNVVAVDGKLRIIEYSDFPKEQAVAQASDGSLLSWAGNIAVHVFDVGFLEKAASGRIKMPFHLACKKLACISQHGQSVDPSEPNAIKFERFIFDLLPAAGQAIVVEVDRGETFAPVKNPPEAEHDTPGTAQAQMAGIHRAWLQKAGIQVDSGTPVEISPLFAWDAKELQEKLSSKTAIDRPTYFR
ncbi:MAG: UDP-N-acetylglucosamine pyrophosphorylase [Planctomycetaceae bacterium]|nr:UDP-N-acetylglucosamine pyrophosphorylase [Planctomycetaceae bacterium]MBP60206.1 UDP-N-acetylglucosamine pyrophosphorylase [Planctomycetaceae bacterium]